MFLLKRKLKPPIYKRKIKISTKFDPNIFESTEKVDENSEKIVGWSFVSPSNYDWVKQVQVFFFFFSIYLYFNHYKKIK